MLIQGDAGEALLDSMKMLDDLGLSVNQIDGREEAESGKQSCVIVEVNGHQTESAIEKAVESLTETGNTVRVLGSYPASQNL